RDAVLAALPKLDNDANRAAAVQSFPWFPADPRLGTALQSVYASLPQPGTARAALLLVAGDLFEPRLLPWVIHEATTGTARGDATTRAALVAKARVVKNPGVRKAMALAIGHLAPHGDASAAAALDAIVSAESLPKDDPLAVVAAILRARAP